VELTSPAPYVRVVREVVAEGAFQHRPDAPDDAVLSAVSEDVE
jgi:hypothetical protein